MPSAAAQAAFDEIVKKENSKLLPEERLSQLRQEACEIVKKVSCRSNVFDKDKEDAFPRFQIDELLLGKTLGKGQFGIVTEVKAFELAPGTPEQTSTKIEVEETQTRRFMSKYCIRNGDARYAIKILRKEVATDPLNFRNGTIDFAIEARFLAVLKHPHIVKMRALSSEGFFQNNSFIIMDRLYDTLEVRMMKWKKEDGRNTSVMGCCTGGAEKYTELMAEKVLTALDLANAMSYMHDMSIMYRDLKPENIGFDVRDEVKLFDFGLAKELLDTPSNKNEDGTYNLTGFTGSISYMAPEVALSEPYNTSADVYSFGILFWIMISTEQPYRTLTLTLIKKLVIQKGHRPTCNTSWPEGISNLIQSCWNPKFDERPSFAEVSATLQLEWSRLSATEYDFDGGLDISNRSVSRYLKSENPPTASA